jgi:hypothetical protein
MISRMRLGPAVLVCGLGLGAAGCGPAELDPSSLSQKVESAGRAAADYAQEQRDSASRAIEQEALELQREMARVREAGRAAGRAKAEAVRRLHELEREARRLKAEADKALKDAKATLRLTPEIEEK